MNAKAIALFASVIAACLSGCTTESESGQLAPLPGPIPEPEITIDLPLEATPVRTYADPQACLLSGTKTCVELDPRPVEPCLANGKICNEQSEGGGFIPLGDAHADTGGVESR